jgi:1-acyl-sn-glycerol-3-phosphate acyltransferase
LDKPAVIISNHQSHIDIPLILMLYPKILILTNDWVQHNFFYGRIVKYADYYPTSDGFEKNLERLKKKVKEGFSILIFPEGSRSSDLEIKRFHKGAFEYAQALNIDILPIIIQGAGDSIPKGEPFLKSGQITVNILQRLKVEDYGIDSRTQAKQIRKYMQQEYSKIRDLYENTTYFRKKLIGNYIYKTPVLEFYTRIKTKIENNYEIFDRLLPKSGHITDIGTGYGYLPYMLSFTSKNRTFTGIDYDRDKILTATNNISKNERLDFINADVTQVELPESDAFILNDVLHYMPYNEQNKLIQKCILCLKPSGIIIIRDGNVEMQKKHKGTKLSEFFSVKLLKFNKAQYDKLYFTSKSEILKTVSPYNFEVSIIDETKHTSNIVYVLKKS